MKCKYPIKVAAAVMLAVLLIAALTGCSEKIAGGDQDAGVTVMIDAKPISSQMINAIDRFELVVEGRDFGSLSFPMAWEGNFIVARIEIPVGTNRRFSARALDKENVVLYRGETTANVTSRLAAPVDIRLSPAVPMINITPHYQATTMGDTVFAEINVFNITDLSQLSLEVSMSFSPACVDSVIRGDHLSDSIQVGYGIYTSDCRYCGVTVGYAPGNVAGRIVDGAGNSHVATTVFYTHSDWNADTLTALISVRPTWASLITGGAIPLDSIYTDGAEVFLHRFAATSIPR
jgi:hypothetical protein